MPQTIISDEGTGAVFVQLWTTPTPEDQDKLLAVMKEKMDMFKPMPGFISMTLHPSLDGKRLAVYAQWESQAAFESAVSNNPQAMEARQSFTQYGEYQGALCRVDTVIQAQAAPATMDDEFNRVFSHHTAAVNGVNIHYVMGGQGEPVLLVHGHPESWYAWRKIMPALAQHYTLIVPDMRGYGDSSKPETGYEKHIVAEDLHQLLQSLNVQRYYLAAYDMGVPVAYALAAAHPEQVIRFVSMESGGPPGFGLEELFAVAWHFGFFMSPELPEMLTAGREREFLTTFAFRGRWVYQEDALSNADVAEYVRCNGTPSGMRAAFAYYRAFPTDAQYNRETFKGKLKMPVLALAGAHGLGDVQLKGMQAVAENVRGAVIPECGHFIPEEQPEVLTQHILDFFREEQQ
ncbi:alpha/beta fold hydrolase [Cyanobacteria bacterium FACHB-471]|nr:alpha/beta fold hydrolase [Cyanobacteria bacterium FACHB-471]